MAATEAPEPFTSRRSVPAAPSSAMSELTEPLSRCNTTVSSPAPPETLVAVPEAVVSVLLSSVMLSLPPLP